MGVENTNVGDLLGIDPKSDMVTLTVVDTLDWQNEEEHVARLQEKLNTYLRFIESDEIDQTYPKGIAKKRCIEIFAQHQPTVGGHELLKHARELIERAGFAFHFQIGLPMSQGEGV